jgi:hypothetical protein
VRRVSGGLTEPVHHINGHAGQQRGEPASLGATASARAGLGPCSSPDIEVQG